jgi:hypothetical protein
MGWPTDMRKHKEHKSMEVWVVKFRMKKYIVVQRYG